tara:strand:- start:406 stop:633 length:228 start_codon:yes stop_codon:yes gene_type:complete
MERIIKITPIKREYLNSRGFSKINWTCELEVFKFDGTKQIIKGFEFMTTKERKKDMLLFANKEVNRILSNGNFYF